jgi:hypothetical protein
MTDRDIHTKDKNLAKFDVKYKTVWRCKDCNASKDFPTDAWNAWSKDQQDAFKAELDRQHQHEG